MAELKLVVFNVERGLCVYARTPNNYAVMIDCGRSADFSPAEWIATSEAPHLSKWQNKTLSWLIVTHPHDDHVEDIATVKSKLPPAILRRHKDYDWDTVLNPKDGDPSKNAIDYHTWQLGYSSPVKEYPELGLEMKIFGLSPDTAGAINNNSQQLLNNSSLVTVLTYKPTNTSLTWKVVVAGDNETAGWKKLLEQNDFKETIRGADFFVTPHHGHESGFCSELFDVMGKPIWNITSEREGDQSVYSGYTNYARGAYFYGNQRSHITTRNDGHIVLRLNDTGNYTCWASKHEKT